LEQQSPVAVFLAKKLEQQSPVAVFLAKKMYNFWDGEKLQQSLDFPNKKLTKENFFIKKFSFC